MSYTFAQLMPERVPNAGVHNAPLLGSISYGIEVTEPELARQCRLGNLDPQHSGADSGQAAVEAALTCTLPPAGACLVTVRPDMDSVATMAIFSLRASGVPLSSELVQRVRLVGKADRFDYGPWPGPRPLPATDTEWLAFASEPLGLAPISTLAMDMDVSLDERVKSVGLWLETGEIPLHYPNAVEQHAARLAAAYSNGRMIISVPIEGRLALIISDVKDALRLGYFQAPAVLAVAAAPGQEDTASRKITVAQYRSGVIDLRALAAKLNAIESGWGGSATILGSPQGVGSTIAVARLIAEIKQALAGSMTD